jgi:hypothetical protein
MFIRQTQTGDTGWSDLAWREVVSYDTLSENGWIGTGSSQLAAGNHTHTGVYEPADATILKDADIGSTVQGYDAQTAKKDEANDWVTNQTFGEITEDVYTLSGTAIDPGNGPIQAKTISGTTTFTFSNFNLGQSVTLALFLATAQTVNWPTIYWEGGAAPTLETGSLCNLIELVRIGTAYYGAYVGSFDTP